MTRIDEKSFCRFCFVLSDRGDVLRIQRLLSGAPIEKISDRDRDKLQITDFAYSGVSTSTFKNDQKRMVISRGLKTVWYIFGYRPNKGTPFSILPSNRTTLDSRYNKSQGNETFYSL